MHAYPGYAGIETTRAAKSGRGCGATAAVCGYADTVAGWGNGLNRRGSDGGRIPASAI